MRYDAAANAAAVPEAPGELGRAEAEAVVDAPGEARTPVNEVSPQPPPGPAP